MEPPFDPEHWRVFLDGDAGPTPKSSELDLAELSRSAFCPNWCVNLARSGMFDNESKKYVVLLLCVDCGTLYTAEQKSPELPGVLVEVTTDPPLLPNAIGIGRDALLQAVLAEPDPAKHGAEPKHCSALARVVTKIRQSEGAELRATDLLLCIECGQVYRPRAKDDVRWLQPVRLAPPFKAETLTNARERVARALVESGHVTPSASEGPTP